MHDCDEIAKEHHDKFLEKLADLDEVRTRRIHNGDVFDYLLKKYESEIGPASGINSGLSSFGDDDKKAYRLGYINALNDIAKAIFIANDVQRSKIIDLMMWEAREHDADLREGE